MTRLEQQNELHARINALDPIERRTILHTLAAIAPRQLDSALAVLDADWRSDTGPHGEPLPAPEAHACLAEHTAEGMAFRCDFAKGHAGEHRDQDDGVEWFDDQSAEEIAVANGLASAEPPAVPDLRPALAILDRINGLASHSASWLGQFHQMSATGNNWHCLRCRTLHLDLPVPEVQLCRDCLPLVARPAAETGADECGVLSPAGFHCCGAAGHPQDLDHAAYQHLRGEGRGKLVDVWPCEQPEPEPEPGQRWDCRRCGTATTGTEPLIALCQDCGQLVAAEGDGPEGCGMAEPGHTGVRCSARPDHGPLDHAAYGPPGELISVWPCEPLDVAGAAGPFAIPPNQIGDTR